MYFCPVKQELKLRLDFVVEKSFSVKKLLQFLHKNAVVVQE